MSSLAVRPPLRPWRGEIYGAGTGYPDGMPRKHDREKERREARKVVEDAGGGEAEGFEQSEEALRRQAEHIDAGRNPKYDAGRVESERSQAVYGEADAEHSSETRESDR